MAKLKSFCDSLRAFLSTPPGQILALTVLVLATHFPLLVIRQIENPDAGMIYENLERLRFPGEYLRALVDFQTYDFQPVRDLTLYLDLWFFQKTGLVISVLLNCLIWVGCCYQVLKILEDELGRKPSWQLLLFVACFSVYPIFQVTVNWGIARKHLLSFFFILCATSSLLGWEKDRRSFLPIVGYFLLSLLSLPLSIGWPLWVLFREGGRRGFRQERSRALLLSLFLISFCVGSINFAYYKTSYVFLETYFRKASDFRLELVSQNLGLQFRQMIFPYRPGIFHNFDSYSLLYCGLFLGSCGLLFTLRKRHPRIWMWPLFGVLPMLVILTTPHVYFDTYVLVPTFALFMLIMTVWIRERLFWARYAILPLILWSAFTYHGNTFWSDPVAFAKQGFEEGPNCTNARSLGYRYYKSGKKLPDTLFDFIQVNECLKVTAQLPPNVAIKILSFEAMLLYYEDEIDPSYRRERLEELSHKTIFPLVVYASYLARAGEADALEELMREQNQLLKNNSLTFQYEPILAERVPDFCRERQLPECLKYLERWQKKPKPQPYY